MTNLFLPLMVEDVLPHSTGLEISSSLVLLAIKRENIYDYNFRNKSVCIAGFIYMYIRLILKYNKFRVTI